MVWLYFTFRRKELIILYFIWVSNNLQESQTVDSVRIATKFSRKSSKFTSMLFIWSWDPLDVSCVALPLVKVGLRKIIWEIFMAASNCEKKYFILPSVLPFKCEIIIHGMTLFYLSEKNIDYIVFFAAF